ncbi:glycosyltransferase family 2 protein [Vibrio natriegens]|uniref:glycosyltransferase family 2 protein n=1 Tax=Vibrio natriegens TaxID=691 RepID=UPI003F838283
MKNETNPDAFLVSFIVPVYNVEKYVGGCIESILEQSYRNIELILINDGSSDKSGDILEKYSEIDSRIKVVHCENRGVSTARNIGLKKSRGHYIVFVDADDYICKDYCSYMLSLFKGDDPEFVMSKNCQKFPGYETSSPSENISTLSSTEVTSLLLYPGKVEIGCWNKMFKSEFLKSNNLNFPIGYYMGEGLQFIVKASQLASRVTVGSKKVYYYRKDNESSATTVLNIPKYFNAIKSLDAIETIVNPEEESVFYALKLHRYLTVYSAVNAILITGNERRYQVEYDELHKFMKDNLKFLSQSSISISMKFKIFLYSLAPKLTHVLFDYIRKARSIVR